MLTDATDGVGELEGATVGLADGVELTTETVFVTVGVALDLPQFHQLPEAVTVTVRVSRTTLVTIYLLSNMGLDKVAEARSAIASTMVFILDWNLSGSSSSILR